MPVKVRIPTPLQKITDDRSEVEAEGETIGDLINDLERNYPGMKERLCDEKGKIRRFVNIYVNDEDIRFLDQEGTQLKEGDEVSIIPAIAGGSKKALTLFFPQHLIKEPVMFLTARDHDLILNIRRARITKDSGEATIELEGSEADIQKALDAFKRKGLRVEPVLGDLVE